jgi:hypothetical protein
MSRNITLTPEQIEKIIYLRETGSTLEEIRNAIGTTYECVRKVITDNNIIIKMKKLNITPAYVKPSPYDHLFEEPMNPGKKDYKAYVRDGR